MCPEGGGEEVASRPVPEDRGRQEVKAVGKGLALEEEILSAEAGKRSGWVLMGAVSLSVKQDAPCSPGGRARQAEPFPWSFRGSVAMCITELGLPVSSTGQSVFATLRHPLGK